MNPPNTSYVRASISFPRDIYQNLKHLSTQKKVSVAWVVREAAERYVAAETAKAGKEPRRIMRTTGK
jgi:predicted transcriptional regulator